MSVRVIAHRGGSGLRVENTLAAFANSLAIGADGAELDVHLSLDGQVVVHHDDRLNPAYCRHRGGGWIGPGEAVPLATLTYVQMQAYDISLPRPGSAYARRFECIQSVPGQTIPLLRDVLDLCKTRSQTFVVVVEIKTPLLEAANRPWVRLVDATLEVVRQADFFDRTVFCSFDWGALRYARQCQPGLATWFTTCPLSWFGGGQPPPCDIPPGSAELRALREQYATGKAPWFAGFDPRACEGSYPRAVAAAQGSAWFPYYRDFTPELARELARAGLGSAVWSVNLRDADELARVARMGVDNVVVDYPLLGQ